MDLSRRGCLSTSMVGRLVGIPKCGNCCIELLGGIKETYFGFVQVDIHARICHEEFPYFFNGSNFLHYGSTHKRGVIKELEMR